MSVKFKLTGALSGKTLTLANRYEFKDGILECSSNSDAELLKIILCGYYGCEVQKEADKKPASRNTSTSLAVENTQP